MIKIVQREDIQKILLNSKKQEYKKYFICIPDKSSISMADFFKTKGAIAIDNRTGNGGKLIEDFQTIAEAYLYGIGYSRYPQECVFHFVKNAANASREAALAKTEQTFMGISTRNFDAVFLIVKRTAFVKASLSIEEAREWLFSKTKVPMPSLTEHLELRPND